MKSVLLFIGLFVSIVNANASISYTLYPSQMEIGGMGGIDIIFSEIGFSPYEITIVKINPPFSSTASFIPSSNELIYYHALESGEYKVTITDAFCGVVEFNCIIRQCGELVQIEAAPVVCYNQGEYGIIGLEPMDPSSFDLEIVCPTCPQDDIFILPTAPPITYYYVFVKLDLFVPDSGEADILTVPTIEVSDPHSGCVQKINTQIELYKPPVLTFATTPSCASPENGTVEFTGVSVGSLSDYTIRQLGSNDIGFSFSELAVGINTFEVWVGSNSTCSFLENVYIPEASGSPNLSFSLFGCCQKSEVGIDFAVDPSSSISSIISMSLLNPDGFEIWAIQGPPVINPTNRDYSFSGFISGEYTLTVTDSSGCKHDFTGYLDSPGRLILESDWVVNATCAGYNEGMIQFSVQPDAATLTSPEGWDISCGANSLYSWEYSVINEAGIAVASGTGIASYDNLVIQVENLAAGSYCIEAQFAGYTQGPFGPNYYEPCKVTKCGYEVGVESPYLSQVSNCQYNVMCNGQVVETINDGNIALDYDNDDCKCWVSKKCDLYGNVIPFSGYNGIEGQDWAYLSLPPVYSFSLGGNIIISPDLFMPLTYCGECMVRKVCPLTGEMVYSTDGTGPVLSQDCVYADYSGGNYSTSGPSCLGGFLGCSGRIMCGYLDNCQDTPGQLFVSGKMSDTGGFIFDCEETGGIQNTCLTCTPNQSILEPDYECLNDFSNYIDCDDEVTVLHGSTPESSITGQLYEFFDPANSLCNNVVNMEVMYVQWLDQDAALTTNNNSPVPQGTCTPCDVYIQYILNGVYYSGIQQGSYECVTEVVQPFTQEELEADSFYGQQGGCTCGGFSWFDCTLILNSTNLSNHELAYHCFDCGDGKTSALSSSDNVDNRSFDFTVFPNPNYGLFSIKFKDPMQQVFNLRVVNLLGTVVYSKAFQNTGTELQIDLTTGITDGMYYVVIENSTGSQSKSIIITK